MSNKNVIRQWKFFLSLTRYLRKNLLTEQGGNFGGTMRPNLYTQCFTYWKEDRGLAYFIINYWLHRPGNLVERIVIVTASFPENLNNGNDNSFPQ